jgi:hypothetical protein
MKIQVVRSDGRLEVLNLIGTIRVTEPAPGGLASLLLESTGTIHFFCGEDGTYEGWGMEVSDLGFTPSDAAAFANEVEKHRTIYGSGEVA